MNTPPDFSALEQAFARQHAEFARLKAILTGLDSDFVLDVPAESWLDFTEASEVPARPSPPPGSGVRA